MSRPIGNTYDAVRATMDAAMKPDQNFDFNKAMEEIAARNEFIDDYELKLEVVNLRAENEALKGQLDCALDKLAGAEDTIRIKDEIIENQKKALKEYRELAWDPDATSCKVGKKKAGRCPHQIGIVI